MCPLQRLPHLLLHHMRVSLRHGDRRMAQQFLHDAQVGSVAQQQSRDRVAERVRRDAAGDAGVRAQAADYVRDGLGGEGGVGGIGEEGIRGRGGAGGGGKSDTREDDRLGGGSQPVAGGLSGGGGGGVGGGGGG